MGSTDWEILREGQEVGIHTYMYQKTISSKTRKDHFGRKKTYKTI